MDISKYEIQRTSLSKRQIANDQLATNESQNKNILAALTGEFLNLQTCVFYSRATGVYTDNFKYGL